jgi:uncharacterized protein (TIGR03545 family)
MHNPLRITGLLVFLAVVSIAGLVYVVFIDSVVASVIKSSGSQAIGARVELESVDVSLGDQRLALEELAVANPSSPMTNLFQAEQLVMDVDAGALAWNKVVVDEVLVTNLRLGTKRETSGAIDNYWADAKTWNPISELATFDDLSLDDLPDPEMIIKKEGLQTPAAIKAFEEKLKATEASLTNQYQQLPTKEDIQSHQEKLDQILAKSDGQNKFLSLLGKGKEIKELRNEIKKDLEKLKQFKETLANTKTELATDIKQLKSMPDKDWQRLKQKYSLSGNGVNELVSSVFGPQMGDWAQTAWNYYQLVQPYLDKYQPGTNETTSETTQMTERGRKILFPDEHPLPNYLVRKIHIDSPDSSDGIGISGTLENLTTEPGRLGKPMTVDLSGTASFLAKFTLNALLDHRDPQAAKDTIQLSLDDVAMRDFMANNKATNFEIQAGNLNLKADISLEQSALDATIFLDFEQLQLTVADEGDWQTMVVDGLNKLDRFNVTLQLSGDIMQPEVKIISGDLSKLGQQMLRSMASDKLAEFENGLRTAIIDQTSGPLSRLPNLDSISQLEKQINLSEIDLTKLLQAGG